MAESILKTKKLLIYGVTGYTGKLMAQALVDRGIRPVLAGRSDAIEEIGEQLDCETRIFETDSSGTHLEDIDALVNLAGPFNKTQEGLIEGCMQTKTHYLDIAGEVPEVMAVHSHHREAREAGIILLPAAGFGVVPTDIAAKMACDRLEDPVRLTIGYATRGRVSKGTLKTVLASVNAPGIRLVEGEQTPAEPAETKQSFKVFDRVLRTVYNPWRADLFTAQLSTGVSNIDTYSAFPNLVVQMMKGRMLWVRKLLMHRLMRFLPEGPSKKQLARGSTSVIAIARSEHNTQCTVEMQGPEAYVFTILSLEKMLEFVLESESLSGMLTPSAFGTKWLEDHPDIEIKVSSKGPDQ